MVRIKLPHSITREELETLIEALETLAGVMVAGAASRTDRRKVERLQRKLERLRSHKIAGDSGDTD